MVRKKYKEKDVLSLVIYAKNGDLRALEELIKREQKNIYTAFCFLGANKETIADLTQEALLRMSKNIHKLKNPQNFKAWLGQIISNLFYDDLRKKQRSINAISIDSFWLEEEHQNSSSLNICDNKSKPDKKSLENELCDIIKDSICNLPEHFRIVIILRDLQGLSYDDIAKITQTNVGTVKSRIARARNKLQEILKPYLT